MRQNETHWPNNVRRRLEQHFTFDQRFTHKPELVILQVAQAAVNELSRARRRTLGEIAFFAEEDAQAPSRSIAGDARPVHAASNNGNIDRSVILHLSVRLVSGHSRSRISLKKPQLHDGSWLSANPANHKSRSRSWSRP